MEVINNAVWNFMLFGIGYGIITKVGFMTNLYFKVAISLACILAFTKFILDISISKIKVLFRY